MPSTSLAPSPVCQMKAEILFWVLIGIALLISATAVIYELRKAGADVGHVFNKMLDRVFGPDTVVMPPNLQHFVNEAANQEGGYTPWVPPPIEDESYPPAWLNKGGK